MTRKPYWKPSKETIEHSNIYKMMQQHGFENYDDFWKWSVTHKEEFWTETVQNLGIQFQEKHAAILNTSEGVEKAKWLYNSKLNIVDSCFQNEDDAVVLVFQNEGEELQKVTQQ